MTESTEQSRREAMTQAIASSRLEGFEPDPEFLALVERYIVGELTTDDLRRILDEMEAKMTTSP